MAKRNKPKRDKDKNNENKPSSEGGTPGAVAASTTSLESFSEGLCEVTDEGDIPVAVGLVPTDGSPASESANTSWCCIVGAGDVDGVHKSATISDDQWNLIIENGGAIYEFDTEAEAVDSLAMLVDEDDSASAEDARTHDPAAPPGPETLFDGDAAPPESPAQLGLGSPPPSAAARYAAPGGASRADAAPVWHRRLWRADWIRIQSVRAAAHAVGGAGATGSSGVPPPTPYGRDARARGLPPRRAHLGRDGQQRGI